MSVSTNGVVTTRPFAYAADGMPMGILRGAAQSTGDASGGTNTVTFALDPGYAYSIRAVSHWQDDTTFHATLYEIRTGISFPSQAHILFHLPHQSGDPSPVAGATRRQGATWSPPPLIFLPDPDTSPTISAVTVNTNTVNLAVTVYGLMFDPEAVRKQPFLLAGLFFT